MKKRFALAALLAAAPFAAPAQALSYSYVEGGYNNATPEDGYRDDADLDGPYIRGSIEIGDSFHLFGSYTTLSGEEKSASNSGGHTYDIDFDTAELGFGYHHGLGDRLDLIAEISLVNQQLEITRTTRPFFGDPTPYTVTELDESATASKLALGVRGAVTDQLEGWAKGAYLGGGDEIESGFSATLGGQVKIGRTWGVVGELELSESWNQFRLGVRASF